MAILAQVAKPMSSIDKITVIDTGEGSSNTGASKIAKTVTNVAGTGFEVLKDLTGLDVTELMKKFTQKDSSPAQAPEDNTAEEKKEPTAPEEKAAASQKPGRKKQI